MEIVPTHWNQVDGSNQARTYASTRVAVFPLVQPPPNDVTLLAAAINLQFIKTLNLYLRWATLV